MDGIAVARHFERLDWFASDTENLNAGICFRSLCELADLFRAANLESKPCALSTWIESAGLDVDEIAWTCFKTLDSSVGGLVQLSSASLAMVCVEAGEVTTIQRHRRSFRGPSCVVGADNVIDGVFIETLSGLHAEAVDLGAAIRLLPVSFAIGRPLIFRGLFLCLESLAAMRAIEYASVLVDVSREKSER